MEESIVKASVATAVCLLALYFGYCIIVYIPKLVNYFKTKYENWRLKEELAQLYQDLKTNSIYNIYESQYNKFSRHKQTITILNKDNGFIKYQVIDYTCLGHTRTYEESSHIKKFYNTIYKYRYIPLTERDAKFWGN